MVETKSEAQDKQFDQKYDDATNQKKTIDESLDDETTQSKKEPEEWEKVTIRELAKELCYRDKEHFDTESGKKTFVDPVTYIRREREKVNQLIDENRAVRNKMDSLTASVHKMLNYQDIIHKREMEQEIEKLKQERRSAIEEADVDKVDKIDKKLDEIHQGDKQKPESTTVNAPNPIFVEWHNRNDWYDTDDFLTTFANTIATQETAKGNNDLTKILPIIDRKVKEFREMQKREEKTDTQQQSGDVAEGATRFSKHKKTITYNDLDPKEQIVIDHFCELNPKMTKERYVKELVESGAFDK